MSEIQRRTSVASGVTTAKDADEFVSLIRERLAHLVTMQERRAISEGTKDETWEAKVKQLLALIPRLPAPAGAGEQGCRRDRSG